MIYLQEVVALGHFKDVIQTFNAPLPSVNNVPSYPTNYCQTEETFFYFY